MILLINLNSSLQLTGLALIAHIVFVELIDFFDVAFALLLKFADQTFNLVLVLVDLLLQRLLLL